MIVRREYNSDTIEIWNIVMERTNCMNYLVITDQRRPSTVNDYPWISDEEKALFESRDNFIKVQFVSNKSLEDSQLTYEDVSELTGSLLNHVAQAQCDWNIEFILNNDSNDILGDLRKVHRINNASTYKYLSQN